MNLPNSYTTVTPFSKILAAILFITFPFIGLYLGMQYQKNITGQPPSHQIADFKSCEGAGNPILESVPRQCETPDGRIFVEEQTNISDVTPAPSSDGPKCGGRADIKCPTGYYCNYLGDNLYAAGECVKEETASNQTTGCTDDAKICPDGSGVGRTGPNCEFAACPTN